MSFSLGDEKFDDDDMVPGAPALSLPESHSQSDFGRRDSSLKYVVFGGLISIGLLLMVSLLPFSYQAVEYHEYGLLQSRTTSEVFTGNVYSPGRYWEGPDFVMKKFTATAHFVDFAEFGIFSAAESNETVGVTFYVDITFSYFLKQSEIGDLYKTYAFDYAEVVEARAAEAIRNRAGKILTEAYFGQRTYVAEQFKDAVILRLNDSPAMPVEVDQLYVGAIRVEESLSQKKMERVLQAACLWVCGVRPPGVVDPQHETNAAEEYRKVAQLERDYTAVQVNQIQLEKTKVLELAASYGTLAVQKAEAEATQLVEMTRTEGFRNLTDKLNVTEEKHKASFDYLYNLDRMEDANATATFLSDFTVFKI
ncbi:hypothetical protein CYMTET_48986 [Cymbomonas tetramitiformis]|uniref:Band 7 domain-containing protein n=1 Tax=Cymbomonas tetramitiformis TaxID=36881 RepID=A0AAE0BSU4_9CHLO|nr:hypothetical protein CYMTET_48986 [Cymbomonas tetramitiformis]